MRHNPETAGNGALRVRIGLASLGLCLLLSLHRVLPRADAQSAVSHSLPGQEDLTFWANHNGLSQIDFSGPVGFGDLARVLLRRPSNAPLVRALRDRFTFRAIEPWNLNTPDLFRVELTPSGLEWRQTPVSLAGMARNAINIPMVIRNATGQTQTVTALLSGGSPVQAEVPAGQSAPLLLKLLSEETGVRDYRVGLRALGSTHNRNLRVDVRPRSRLRVRLREDGKPVAARIYLTAADGLAYTPDGAIHRIAPMSAEPYFHARDRFELEVPAGSTRIEAVRGPEYDPVAIAVDAVPARTTEVTVQLKRWIHAAALGWHSGDAHIHANYTAEHHQVITPADVALQALGEDLGVSNLMVANSSGSFLHDERFFRGAPEPPLDPGHILYWNEEMRNAGLYGHMCFFRLKSLVQPVYTGFRDTPYWEDFPANFTQAAAARRQGGAVTYAHPGYAATFEGSSARELPVDLALGEVDAMDVLSNNFEEATTQLWYHLLNCGFRLAISAGTDAFTNVADHYVPGGGRVYVYTGRPELEYDVWVDRFKRGRSFASNGPVLDLQVDGHRPGDEISLNAPGHLRLRAQVDSQIPPGRIELLVNGTPVRSWTPSAGQKRFSIRERLRIESSSWIALRADGEWNRMVLNDSRVFAHTSPVYVTVGGRAIRDPRALRFYFEWIEKLIARTRERGRFADEGRRAEVLQLFEKALNVYRTRLAAARE